MSEIWFYFDICISHKTLKEILLCISRVTLQLIELMVWESWLWQIMCKSKANRVSSPNKLVTVAIGSPEHILTNLLIVLFYCDSAERSWS